MSETSATPIVIAFAFTLSCGVWVYFDAQRIGRREGASDHHGAMAWAAGTVLLWIVVFPMYFVSRFKRLKKLNLNEVTRTTSSASSRTAGYIGAGAAAAVAAGAARAR